MTLGFDQLHSLPLVNGLLAKQPAPIRVLEQGRTSRSALVIQILSFKESMRKKKDRRERGKN